MRPGNDGQESLENGEAEDVEMDQVVVEEEERRNGMAATIEAVGLVAEADVAATTDGKGT